MTTALITLLPIPYEHKMLIFGGISILAFTFADFVLGFLKK